MRRAVANTYPNTEWGEYAFLELLLDGFGTNPVFDEANPAAVVERGTAFLREKPTSPHRPLILFAVAQASETLWSLSIAPAHDECVDTSHRQNTAEKQKRAIAAYEALVKALGRPEPSSQFASRQIVRVRAGFDTGARYFFDCYP